MIGIVATGSSGDWLIAGDGGVFTFGVRCPGSAVSRAAGLARESADAHTGCLPSDLPVRRSTISARRRTSDFGLLGACPRNTEWLIPVLPSTLADDTKRRLDRHRSIVIWSPPGVGSSRHAD